MTTRRSQRFSNSIDQKQRQLQTSKLFYAEFELLVWALSFLMKTEESAPQSLACTKSEVAATLGEFQRLEMELLITTAQFRLRTCHRKLTQTLRRMRLCGRAIHGRILLDLITVLVMITSNSEEGASK